MPKSSPRGGRPAIELAERDRALAIRHRDIIQMVRDGISSTEIARKLNYNDPRSVRHIIMELRDIGVFDTCASE